MDQMNKSLTDSLQESLNSIAKSKHSSSKRLQQNLTIEELSESPMISIFSKNPFFIEYSNLQFLRTKIEDGVKSRNDFKAVKKNNSCEQYDAYYTKKKYQFK